MSWIRRSERLVVAGQESRPLDGLERGSGGITEGVGEDPPGYGSVVGDGRVASSGMARENVV